MQRLLERDGALAELGGLARRVQQGAGSVVLLRGGGGHSVRPANVRADASRCWFVPTQWVGCLRVDRLAVEQRVVSGLGGGLGLAGVCGGLGAVVDTEFGPDGADVVADGSGADVQAGGDVGVAVAGGQECEYFAFAAAQLLCVGEDVGAAAAAGRAAQRCQSVLSTRGRPPEDSPGPPYLRLAEAAYFLISLCDRQFEGHLARRRPSDSCRFQVGGGE